MSLLSSFVTEHLITAIEAEFVAHQAEIQEKLIEQAKILADELYKWATAKVEELESPKAE